MKWSRAETAKNGRKYSEKVSGAGSHPRGRRFDPVQVHQKERHDLRRVFLFGNCKVFHCSAEVNSACAKVFARGENACTAHQRHPDLRGPILCWHPCCLDATKIDKLRQRFADLFCPLFLLHATQWARLQFLVWRSDAILRVISTGMYGILEWMRGSSQSNHIILRRNGSTCVQNDARYFPWVLPCRCIIIKNFWIPFLAFSALDVTSYQLSGLAPTHSTMPCSISVPQFKHVLFPSPALFHNFLACA